MPNAEMTEKTEFFIVLKSEQFSACSRNLSSKNHGFTVNLTVKDLQVEIRDFTRALGKYCNAGLAFALLLLLLLLLLR
jgi:hypothetical protein